MKNGAEYDSEIVNCDFTVDWKERPDAVMHSVNATLARFGLEVINHETGGDFHAFSIQKKDS